MADFACRVEPSRDTTCSYTGLVDMLVVKVEQDRGANRITIEIKIFPPLYAWIITPEAQLIKIFSIVNPEISVSRVTYNPQSSTIKLEGSVTKTLEDTRELQIVFSPSQSTLGVYYSSVGSSTTYILTRSLYYYSDFSLQIGQYLPYLCYCIVALAWISYGLGLVLRRLAGLESFIVVQYCWIAIVMAKGDVLYVMEQMAALRFSTGYNHHFIEDPSSAASSPESPPYLQKYQLSRRYMVNNFSFPSLLLLAALVAAIFTTVRYRRHQSSLSLTAYEANANDAGDNKRQNDPIREQQDKQNMLLDYMSQSQQAYTCLMYASMGFLVCFVFAVCTFFQYGTISNIPSLALLLLNVCIYVFALVQYIRDPCLYTYFRFSFASRPLALNFYGLKGVFLLVITLLVVVLCPMGYAWVAGIPVVCMLGFVLAYRPYKDAKENIRAAFNYLVMACFLAMGLYAQMVPRSQLSNDETIKFLMAIMMLLPVVLAVSLVSTIYNYYYQNYLIPEQERRDRQNEDPAIRDAKQKRSKILRQLGLLSMRGKIEESNIDTTFRQIVPPSQNLTNVSNALRIQFLRQTSGAGGVAQDEQSHRYRFYKGLIRREMISKSPKNRDKGHGDGGDGKVYGFDRCEQQNLQQVQEDPQQEQQKQALQRQQIIGSRVQKLGPKIEQGGQGERREEVVARKVLIDENRYVNLRGAIEYVQEDIRKQAEPNGDKFLEEFDKIKI